MQAARQKNRLLHARRASFSDGEYDDPSMLRGNTEDEGWVEDSSSDDPAIDHIPLAPPSESEELWEDSSRSPQPLQKHRWSLRRRVRRGEVCGLLCCALIVCAWVLFLGTAMLRLRSKEDRGSNPPVPSHIQRLGR
jgi:hypothetical protein